MSLVQAASWIKSCIRRLSSHRTWLKKKKGLHKIDMSHFRKHAGGNGPGIVVSHEPASQQPLLQDETHDAKLHRLFFFFFSFFLLVVTCLLINPARLNRTMVPGF